MRCGLYYCDYNRRGKCGNSPLCVANGGPCQSTDQKKWAMRGVHGEYLINKEGLQNENELEGSLQK